MEIKQFGNKYFNLNVLIDENNTPLFFGKEIAEFLDYKDTDQAIRRHVKAKYKLELKDVCEPVVSRGIPPNKILIKEPGLYSLVLSSKLPQAEAFQDWVLEEVIPQIHKTGSYSLNNGLLQLRDISEEDVKNMSRTDKKELKGSLKKIFALLKDPEKQERASRGGKACWRKIREKDVLYEEMQKKFAAISLILGN